MTKRPLTGRPIQYDAGDQTFIDGTAPLRPRLNSRRAAKLRYSETVTNLKLLGEVYGEIMTYFEEGRVPLQIQYAAVQMAEQELFDRISADRPSWGVPENN